MNLLEAYLAGPGASAVDGRLAPRGGWLMITPRYPDSRHVVLVGHGRGRAPGLVAKVVRAPDDRSTLGHEAEVLAALPGVPGAAVPSLLALDRFGGHWLLLETAVTGRPVSHHDVRRDPTRWQGVVDAWLRALPLTEVAPGSADQPTSGPLGDPLRRQLDLAASSMTLTAAERRLLGRTWQALRPLAAAGWPTVVEHGDLSHPNLLWGRDGLAVVDWESGHVDGLPGGDAAVFGAFVAFAVAGAHGVDREVEAFVAAFLRPDGRGRAVLAQHLRERGLDPGWVDHVLVAAWCRNALSVFSRLLTRGGSDEPATRERVAAAFRGHRSLRLWQLALDHLEAAAAPPMAPAAAPAAPLATQPATEPATEPASPPATDRVTRPITTTSGESPPGEEPGA